MLRIVGDEYRPIEKHVLCFRLRHAVPRPALLVVAPIPVEPSKAGVQLLEIGYRSSIWSSSTFRQIVSVRVAQVPDDGNATHWLARRFGRVERSAARMAICYDHLGVERTSQMR
ncbi:hypothetical protein [Gemmatimonas sp.]|uniref:hypothetical protein n=1 Tax=Gemmatimonas sp. TaxID=1962908 RepID=UPI003566E0E2